MNQPKSCIGIKKSVLENICALIRAHKPVEKIVLFGSRARRDCRAVSDIDIAIFARDWDGRDINLVKDALEETIKTPLKFDLVNYYLVAKPSLRQKILKEGKVLYGA
jgi:predicted nucleotidyltransferase